MTSIFRNNVPDYLARVLPDIVVFTAGAHFQDHGDLEVVLGLLEAELRPWYAKVPLFIWKSQTLLTLAVISITLPSMRAMNIHKKS